jgi:HEXXH motif-containing protein
MELATQIHKFIEYPFPLWETNLTKLLIQHKWSDLQKHGLDGPVDYSTPRVWLKNPVIEQSKRIAVANNNTFLEMPSFYLLKSFYDEHGLEPLTEKEIEANAVLQKLGGAMSILKYLKSACDCITILVHSIQVLQQPVAEIDVSYSHPEIPFSIFLSVCEDESTISNLRVAESILHEAMHLKLTLIENIVSLVKSDNNLYYSPWRDEERPVRGVLHGLFVFRAIYKFYSELNKSDKLGNVGNYFNLRKEQLENEISSLKGFPQSLGLTDYGAILATNLLPLN